jgi:hypothetical protein
MSLRNVLSCLPAGVAGFPASSRMHAVEEKRSWVDGKRIPGIPFAYSRLVRIIDGEHTGETSCSEKRPDPF